MTKTEVLKTLSNDLNLTQAETETLYDEFVRGLTVLLSRNKGFTLPGLGSFHTETRPPHISYNPHYQQKMRIPKKKVVHYSQSKTLRDFISEGENEQ